ncbi:hypothetical protein B0I35DRAFT_414860 [Stachybotrys elegans]|uniref:Uncharacterized protein n=1 Tax=Stachybotrys elegans TaxID=80388 RepID=A0A8K0WKA1_9HYPO|nr:hypothetical protein B0I35DRAFT_414860 [Stachybotrys elegans]
MSDMMHICKISTAQDAASPSRNAAEQHQRAHKAAEGIAELSTKVVKKLRDRTGGKYKSRIIAAACNGQLRCMHEAHGFVFDKSNAKSTGVPEWSDDGNMINRAVLPPMLEIGWTITIPITPSNIAVTVATAPRREMINCVVERIVNVVPRLGAQRSARKRLERRHCHKLYEGKRQSYGNADTGEGTCKRRTQHAGAEGGQSS